jgi:hypothetical protein
MTNAVLVGTALSTDCRNGDDGHTFPTPSAAASARENSDWVARAIARRFGVSPSVAGLIADLSGLRGSVDSRWTKAG